MGIYLSVTAREAGSKGKYRPRRAQEPFDSNCGPVGVERAEGDGVVPVHGRAFSREFTFLSVVNGHHVLGVFTRVEHLDAEEVKAHEPDLGIVLSQLRCPLVNGTSHAAGGRCWKRRSVPHTGGNEILHDKFTILCYTFSR